MKEKILIILITAILTASMSVYATITYTASQIKYTKSNNTEVTLDSALNELYTDVNSTISGKDAQINTLTQSRNVASDNSANHLGLGLSTGGTIDVTQNAYYVITVFYQEGVNISLSNVQVLKSVVNPNHVFGMPTNNNYIYYKYALYYVYTNSNTIGVTASANSKLSYSKMRLFQ